MMMMMRVMMEMMEMKEFSFFPTQKAKCGRQAWTPTGTFDVEQDYDDDVGIMVMVRLRWLWWWCWDNHDYDDYDDGVGMMMIMMIRCLVNLAQENQCTIWWKISIKRWYIWVQAHSEALSYVVILWANLLWWCVWTWQRQPA